MELLIAHALPFIVTVVTQGTKKFSTIELSPKRKGILRFVVALLSYGAVLGSALVAGQPVEPVATETFAQSLLVFLSTVTPYSFGKSKD